MAARDSEGRMSFFDHLSELRSRLVKSLIAIIPAVGVSWAFREEMLDWMVRPLIAAYATLHLGPPKLHFMNPIDPIAAYLKMSFIAGLLLSSPWIFWQLWAFVSPGLYSREKKMAVPFVFFSTLCFVGGALFGYFVVFPRGFETFLGFAGMLPSHNITIEPTITMSEYLDFTTQMLLAFGVVFEVPVVVTFLAAAGIVNWKQLLNFGRWWILIAAIVSAVLTPTPDVASQLLMLVPLVVLYFVSVVVAFFVGRKPDEPKIAPDDSQASS